MGRTRRASAPTRTKAARLLKMGDVVRAKNPSRQEPVRSVKVVASLADGTDVVLDPDEDVTLVDIPEPEDEEL
jgi:hypothetical protein